MRVVIDTNILVSRYLTPHGLAGQILRLWRDERFELLVSEATLEELRDVLQRPSIRGRGQLSLRQIDEIIEGFRISATVVSPTETIQVVVDPDDDKFLECAVAGGAELIVSRDPHLLDVKEYRGIRLVTPLTFLRILDEENDSRR